MPKYALEDIRTFIVRRHWLTGNDGVLTDTEYQLLKARNLVLSRSRKAYLRAFMDGYNTARSGNHMIDELFTVDPWPHQRQGVEETQ